MDSNDLERERGITILAKVTSLHWKDTRINIVDTPGHADFGGEVERILNMVDGVIVLVDASEGPMPQTKFVLPKALKLGLKPIVCINKIDRPDERHIEVVNEVFDLFATSTRTKSSSTSRSSTARPSRAGWRRTRRAARKHGAAVRPDRRARAKPPVVEDGPFRMLVDHHRGQSIPRPHAHRPRARRHREAQPDGQGAVARRQDRSSRAASPRCWPSAASSACRWTKAGAGDIVAIAGLTKATVADTICDPQRDRAAAAQPIDPPTLTMTFRINDGPLAGQEGDKVQSRVIRDRLLREAEGNVALQASRTPRIPTRSKWRAAANCSSAS